MRRASIDDTVACRRWAYLLNISGMWTTDGHMLGIHTVRWCLCMMTNKCSKQVDARLARKYGDRVMATHGSKSRRFPADDLLQLMLDLDYKCFCAQIWPQILAQLHCNSNTLACALTRLVYWNGGPCHSLLLVPLTDDGAVYVDVHLGLPGHVPQFHGNLTRLSQFVAFQTHYEVNAPPYHGPLVQLPCSNFWPSM